jgi:hypothetical protein
MEPPTCRCHERQILDSLDGLGVQASQLRDHRAPAVGTLGTQPCARRLYLKERNADVGEAHLLGAEHQADGVGHVRGIGTAHHGSAELSATDPEKAFSLEDAHRLAQRRLADRELEQEPVLLGQDAAVGQFTAKDASPKLVGDLLGEAAKRNGRLCHDSIVYASNGEQAVRGR